MPRRVGEPADVIIVKLLLDLCLSPMPVGTIIWTSPTGHTYTTYPGSKHLFPTLCAPAATLWSGEPPTANQTGDRGEMMPKRRHTRAHNTAKAITAERRLRRRNRRTKQTPTLLAACENLDLWDR